MTGGCDRNGCGSGTYGDGCGCRGNVTGGQGYAIEMIGRWVTGGCDRNGCGSGIYGDGCGCRGNVTGGQGYATDKIGR